MSEEESEIRFTMKYGPQPKPLVLIPAERLAYDCESETTATDAHNE